MKIPNYFLALLLLFSMSFTVATASPEEPVSTRHWQFTSGDNTVTASSQGIHVTQRLPANTTQFANASAKLLVANASAWKVSFNVRFGVLRPLGAVVRLYKGNDTIGWVGADGWFKHMGVSTGDHDSKLDVPADTDWHHIEYDCSGRTISVWHNGQKIGEGISQGTPDRIFVGSSSPGKNVATQQTEVWLRNVQEEVMTAPPAEDLVVTKPSPQPQIQAAQANNTHSDIFEEMQFEDTSKDSLTVTYDKMVSDISSSVVLDTFANGNIIPVSSYSHVNVGTTHKNPILAYQEDATIFSNFYQIDLSQVDMKSIKGHIMPGSITSESVVPSSYLVMIHSKDNTDSFMEAFCTLGKWESPTKTSEVSIQFEGPKDATAFVQHLGHAVRLITEASSSVSK